MSELLVFLCVAEASPIGGCLGLHFAELFLYFLEPNFVPSVYPNS